MPRPLTAEIVKQGMEPKQESVWLTSAYHKEAEGPPVIQDTKKLVVAPRTKRLDAPGYRYKSGTDSVE